MTLDKDAFAKEVKTLARSLWWIEGVEGGRCLYYSAAALLLFKNLGVDACLQAGSLSWPMIRMEEDDGVSPTHFSYMWEGLTAKNLTRLASGLLPEIHVWVALPKERQVVDFSTGELPEEARRLKVTWTGPTPPDYLWDTCAPAYVRYVPDMVATQIASQLVHILCKETPKRRSHEGH